MSMGMGEKDNSPMHLVPLSLSLSTHTSKHHLPKQVPRTPWGSLGE